jgi:hypothetical protein
MGGDKTRSGDDEDRAHPLIPKISLSPFKTDPTIHALWTFNYPHPSRLPEYREREPEHYTFCKSFINGSKYFTVEFMLANSK